MKSQYIIEPLKLFGTKLLMFALTIFLLTAFSWTILSSGSFFYFSIIVTVFYATALFLGGHEKGIRDGRKISVTPPYPLKGFLIAAESEIVTFFMMLFLLILQGKAAFGKLNMIFCIWNAPFFGFFGIVMNSIPKITKMLTMNIGYVSPIAIIILSYGIGYIFGFKCPDLFEKMSFRLTYKKERK